MGNPANLRWFSVCLVVLTFGALSSWSEADTVELKGGRTLNGKVRDEGNTYVVTTRGGTVRVIKADVVAVHEQPAAATKPTASTKPSDDARSSGNSTTRGAKAVENGQGWTDLLKSIDLKAPSTEGGWARTTNGVMTKRDGRDSRIAKLVLPASPTGAYELEFAFNRRQGSKEIAILFPAGEPAMYWLGGMDGQNSSIDGVYGASDSQSVKILNGKEHRLNLTVQPDGSDVTIDVRIDDKPYHSWRGPQSRLTVESRYAIGDSDSIGLAVHPASSVEFRNIRLRPLTGPSTAVARVAEHSGASSRSDNRRRLQDETRADEQRRESSIFDEQETSGRQPEEKEPKLKRGAEGLVEAPLVPDDLVSALLQPSSWAYAERGFKEFRFGQSSDDVRVLPEFKAGFVPISDIWFSGEQQGGPMVGFWRGELIGYHQEYSGDNATYVKKIVDVFGTMQVEHQQKFSRESRNGHTVGVATYNVYPEVVVFVSIEETVSGIGFGPGRYESVVLQILDRRWLLKHMSINARAKRTLADWLR